MGGFIALKQSYEPGQGDLRQTPLVTASRTLELSTKPGDGFANATWAPTTSCQRRRGLQRCLGCRNHQNGAPGANTLAMHWDGTVWELR